MFNDYEVKRHDEHIIQNGIGGRLTSNDILCEKCGNILGKSIDAEFINQMSAVSILLNTARDRGKTNKTKVNIITDLDISDKNVTFDLLSDFSIVPSRPIYIKYEKNRSLIIFCRDQKSGEQYTKSNEIKNYTNN